MHSYPFHRLPVLFHLNAAHLTGMLFFLTAVSVNCELEIFPELHTRLLVFKVMCSLIYIIKISFMTLIYGTSCILKGFQEKTKMDGVLK